jgi:hypothetical protein
MDTVKSLEARIPNDPELTKSTEEVDAGLRKSRDILNQLHGKIYYDTSVDSNGILALERKLSEIGIPWKIVPEAKPQYIEISLAVDFVSDKALSSARRASEHAEWVSNAWRNGSIALICSGFCLVWEASFSELVTLCRVARD